ncbi:GapA-binding peptide SR1P [Paenibacillus rigui]|uniref:GapA-binding peptide SR1P n=2 Tax=Paenibacillus rigui TaxID=554312 RepID=A0A229UKE1_9BACL|nr:GapA-binding peptide SR1P [Paenibacillus rigui]
MENSPVSLEMGVIICRHCETEIGTFDSEKVTTYYSDCQEQQCLEGRKAVKSENNHPAVR